MKSRSSWTDRIAEIRRRLDDIHTQYIDRRQIEDLFGVSSTMARQLLGRMQPILHGNTLVVEHQDVVDLLARVNLELTVRHETGE
jgi:hypothetical protein